MVVGDLKKQNSRDRSSQFDVNQIICKIAIKLHLALLIDFLSLLFGCKLASCILISAYYFLLSLPIVSCCENFSVNFYSSLVVCHLLFCECHFSRDQLQSLVLL